MTKQSDVNSVSRRAERKLAKMKRSPKDDWDIKDVLTVADAIGLVSKPPTKGSHYKFASPLVGGVWVVPARKPILPESFISLPYGSNQKMSNDYEILVVKLPEEEGGVFMAYVPDLAGCMAHGDTEDEAAEAVRTLIPEWIEMQEEMGREVPVPGSFREHLTVSKAELHDVIESLLEEIATLQVSVESLQKRVAALENPDHLNSMREAIGLSQSSKAYRHHLMEEWVRESGVMLRPLKVSQVSAGALNRKENA